MTDLLPMYTPDRSYADYLQEAGEDHGDDLKRLDASDSSAGLGALAMTITTTPLPIGLISPQVTEPRSFLNGLLSPFSPLLKEKKDRGEYLQFVSLQPCRKVSVVVRILPDNDEEQRCLFPHLNSKTSQIIQKPKTQRNMVVVNPSAFGKHIPSKVTLESARLVAQVAKKSSEDWARLYEFHHVMWPTPDEQSPDHFSTMDSLSRAVVQDSIVELQSSLIISLGQASSCIGGEDSLWTRIISHCQGIMEEKTICTMTLVEVLEDKDSDSFLDLLDSKNKSVAARHVDMKGAVLEGLTQVPIDSIPELIESLSKRKRSNSTIVGTLYLWDNAVSYELNKRASSQITCVELATPASTGKPRKTEDPAVHRKGVVNLGRALRQLLLHATFGAEPVISYRDATLTKVLQRSLESSKVVVLASVSQLSKDYESTLVTLNYIRRLLVKPGKMARSPFKKSETFLEDPHQTPIRQPQDFDSIDVAATPSKQMQEYADSSLLLEQIVADPRQRLAKIFKSSPAPKNPPTISMDFEASEEDYQPVDYMDYDQQRGDENDLQLPELYAERENVSPLEEEDADAPKDESYLRRADFDHDPWYAEQSIENSTFNRDVETSRDESAGNYESVESDENRNHGELYDRNEKNPEDMLGVSEDDMSPIENNEENQSFSGYDYEYNGDKEDSPLKQYVEGQTEGQDSVDREANDLSTDEMSWKLSNDGESREKIEETDIYSIPEDRTQQLEDISQNDSSWFEDDKDLDLKPQTEYEMPPESSSILPSSHDTFHEAYQAINNHRVTEIQDEQNISTILKEDFVSLYQDRSFVSQESSSRHKSPNISSSSVRSAFFSVSPTASPHKADSTIDNSIQIGETPVMQNVSVAEEFPSRSNAAEISERVLRSELPLDSPSYYGVEIETLEGAVSQMQNMHDGLFKASAQSLGRLKDSFHSQQHSLKNLTVEKEELASNIDSLNDEMKKASEEHDEDLQRYEEEVQQLHDRLEQALNDKTDVERIADEAISSQANLENLLKAAQDDFSRARTEAESSQKEKHSILKAKEDLRVELFKIKEHLGQSEKRQKESDRVHHNLEASIELLERDRTRLGQELKEDRSIIEELKKQLKTNEQSLRSMEKETDRLEARRKDERLHVEGLESQSRQFGASLDNLKNERTLLEDLRQKDMAKIEKLREDLREREIVCFDFKAELRERDDNLGESQDKVRHFEAETRKLRATIESLNIECEDLQKLRAEERLELESIRAELMQFKLSYDDVESGRIHHEQLRQEDQATIMKMEDELRIERGWRRDAQQLQLEMTQLKEDKISLKNLVDKMKTEFKLQESGLDRYKNEARDLNEKLAVSREHERYLSNNLDGKVYQLQNKLSESKVELEISNKQKRDFAAKMASAIKKEDNFNRLLQESDGIAEQYRIDALRAKEEVSKLHNLLRSQSTEVDHQMKSFEKQISTLRNELSTTKKQRDDARNKLNTDSFNVTSLPEELNQAKELLTYKDLEIERLSVKLDRDRENMFKMKNDLQRFQSETKEKVGKVVNYHRDSGEDLRKLRSRNRALEAELETTRHERDAYFRTLEMGRQKISSITFKAESGIIDAERKSNAYGDANALPSTRELPDLPLQNSSIDQLLALRAEEIAACLAISANQALQESRSQVFRMEEEKEAETASLKAKIHMLETKLHHAEASKITTAYSRRRRHIIDPME